MEFPRSPLNFPANIAKCVPHALSVWCQRPGTETVPRRLELLPKLYTGLWRWAKRKPETCKAEISELKTYALRWSLSKLIPKCMVLTTYISLCVSNVETCEPRNGEVRCPCTLYAIVTLSCRERIKVQFPVSKCTFMLAKSCLQGTQTSD
jgi:hypothetical protein